MKVVRWKGSKWHEQFVPRRTACGVAIPREAEVVDRAVHRSDRLPEPRTPICLRCFE